MTHTGLTINQLTDALTAMILEEMLAGGFETSHEISKAVEDKLRDVCHEDVCTPGPAETKYNVPQDRHPALTYYGTVKIDRGTGEVVD